MKKLKKGLVQVYTGEGKGKTSAAIGQIVRARGHNFKVCLISFFKDPAAFDYGEIKVLKTLGVDIYHFALRHPYFYKKVKPQEIKGKCLKGLAFMQKSIFTHNYDLLVLDEINIALKDGFVKEKELLNLLEKKPENLEIILTGRGATKGLIEKAALVTQMKNIKHPYDKGVQGRKGIEY